MTEDSDAITVDESELESLIDERVEQRLEEERSKASRRQVLGSLAGIGGAGALGYLGGRAVMGAPSDASGTLYVEQLGDSTNPVSDLYVDQQTTLNNTEQFSEVDVTDLLDIPVYSNDSNAPNETHYWNDSDSSLKYKDANGTVHESGLQDGDNFDGQGSSDFTNINSFSTDNLDITNAVAFASHSGSNQTVNSTTVTKLTLDSSLIEDDASTIEVDTTNNKLILKKSGAYLIGGTITYSGSSNWSAGDRIDTRVFVGGSQAAISPGEHSGVDEVLSPGYAFWVLRETSPNTEVSLRAWHNRGGDESTQAADWATHIAAIKIA